MKANTPDICNIEAGAAEWDGLAMPRRVWAILAVAFGVSASVISGAIVNVALPTFCAEMDVTSSESVWAVNSYQLAIVMTLLIFSNLGDMIGYRRIYITGLILFTLASLGCALATDFTMLIACRVVEGIGAAAVTSINTTIIRIIYPRNRLARGLGLNATIVAVSSVAGPSLAAAVLAVASWHWLFAINIPIGLIAFTLSYRYLPANPVRAVVRRLDWRDCVLNALTFGLLIFSIEAFSHDVEMTVVAATIAATLVIGGFYVHRQLHKPTPLLPFDLLRIPIFSLSILTSICSFTAQMLAMVSLPFILQHNMGYTAVDTGLLLMAWPMVIMVVAPMAGRMVEHIHAGVLGVAGLSIMTAGLLALGMLPARPDVPDIVWRLVLCGMGFGIFQSPNNSIMIASAPTARSGSASGMLATARLIGQSSGAAMVAMLFHVAGGETTSVPMFVAAGFAGLGAMISASRIRLPLPEGLQRPSAKK